MFTPELIAALQVFGATLMFISNCLGLTKTLTEVGVFKKS
jgi:ABC-type molybdate transport system permease subunit